MGDTTTDFNNESWGIDITKVQQLVKAGKKVEAVKMVKDATGWGLKDSKDYVDKVDEGIDPAGYETFFLKKTDCKYPY